jgi:hypothetical protein
MNALGFLQGAINFDDGPLASGSDAGAAATAQPHPLVVADERFPVCLARLVRAALQPEAAFIERHYANMGYWAIVIEPWVLDTGACGGHQPISQMPLRLQAPADMPCSQLVLSSFQQSGFAWSVRV